MTPDPERDLVVRLAELLPAEWRAAGDRRNLWEGPEQPVGGIYRDEAGFARFFGERREIHCDGQLREFDVQLLMRFGAEVGPTPTRSALRRALDVYDALHLSGGFTGASTQATYTDIRATTSPIFIGDRTYSLNFALWCVG